MPPTFRAPVGPLGSLLPMVCRTQAKGAFPVYGCTIGDSRFLRVPPKRGGRGKAFQHLTAVAVQGHVPLLLIG